MELTAGSKNKNGGAEYEKKEGTTTTVRSMEAK